MQFGDTIVIGSGEIDSYDFSTHMVYLKKSQEFLDNQYNWDLANMPFKVFANKEMIYTGSLFPAWSSTMPQGIYIDFPSMYPAYIIKLSNAFDKSLLQDDSNDLRTDDRIIKALKSNNQFHAGLSCSLNEIKILRDNTLTVSFTIVNNDVFNYFILSPDKMGVELFHYFTNGVILLGESGNTLLNHVEAVAPEPLGDWSIDWMDLIKKGKSKTYIINYNSFDSIKPGKYHLYFYYPGLHNIDINELRRPDGRIWLGGVTIKQEYFVQ